MVNNNGSSNHIILVGRVDPLCAIGVEKLVTCEKIAELGCLVRLGMPNQVVLI